MFVLKETATTKIYTLSLHDALPSYKAANPVVISPIRSVLGMSKTE